MPSQVNLLEAYGRFAELKEACREFCGRVNGRVHRETAAVPADRLAAEREHLHPLIRRSGSGRCATPLRPGMPGPGCGAGSPGRNW